MPCRAIGTAGTLRAGAAAGAYSVAEALRGGARKTSGRHSSATPRFTPGCRCSRSARVRGS